VTVIKEAPGYRIDPWKATFLVKLPKGDQIDTYRVEADLKAMRYVTLRVSEKGTPLPEAKVTVGGKEEGVTDAKGEFVYLYQTQPAKEPRSTSPRPVTAPTARPVSSSRARSSKSRSTARLWWQSRR